MKIAVLALMMSAAVLAVAWSNNASLPGQSKEVTFDEAAAIKRPDPLITGAGVHFGIGGDYNYSIQKTSEAIASLGLDSFRDDLPWSVFYNPPSGEARRQPSKLFELLKAAKAEPLIVLGHPNPNVTGGDPPITPAGRSAFADFAIKAVFATRQFNPVYEIWNEWNMNAVPGKPRLLGAGDPADPRAAANYALLAIEAVKEIKQVDPAARVLVGATGVDPGWQWTKAIVSMGALNGAAGLSVHLYNHCEAEAADRTAQEAIDRLYQLQAILQPFNNGKDVPLYITEFGWPAVPKQCPLTPQAAANNIAQFLLWSAATPWLRGAWIYELKDQGTDADGIEDNFGLYDYNYAPKPAACAVREIVKILKDSESFAMQRPFHDLFVVRAVSKNGARLIAWTSRDAIQAKLSLSTETPVHSSALCSGGVIGSKDIEVGATPVVIEADAKASVSFRVSLEQ